MATALTYARRYALFALVGIAGEDDLDAPDIANEPVSSPGAAAAPASARKSRNGTLHQPHLLVPSPRLHCAIRCSPRSQALAITMVWPAGSTARCETRMR
jgi:hypothetical protein